ncbi:MAG TPA: hypothetical protein EYP17_10215 [Candidatus Latescibacteria bacterium]|nr:hypothetical protein [Candidatus Latescibacterota bacterium]
MRKVRGGPMKVLRWTLVYVAAVVLASCFPRFWERRPSFTYPIVFTQYPLHTEERGGGFVFRPARPLPLGSRIVLLYPGEEGPKVLTPEFAAAGYPDVEPSGEHIVFAGKLRPEDNWDIWEMDADGSNKRKVTDGDMGDCIDPVYLCHSPLTPPEFTDYVRWVAFVSNKAGAYDEHMSGPATAIYVRTLEPAAPPRDTVVTWRVTFNLSSDFSPTVLRDGRTLFASWQHMGNRRYPNGIFALLAINWAGTGLNLFYGNHQGALVKTMPCEIRKPRWAVVFIDSDGDTPDGSGRLAWVLMRRPLRTHRVLSRDEGFYFTPHPMPDGRLAVAYKPTWEGDYGIYFFDFQKGTVGRVVYDDPDWNDIDPVAVVRHPEPKGRITIVVDSKQTGHLQCLSVYDSDQPDVRKLRPGQVKRVRFVEGIPVSEEEAQRLCKLPLGIGQAGPGSTSNGATAFVQTRIIGEAPVEEDGSFYVEIAADTPFFIQLLDEDGMALKTMKGWMWVRRGSRRGCIGCHEDKELAPENRISIALRKATPAQIGYPVKAPPEERRTVDFRRDIMPIIRAKCISCHSGASPAGRLDLGTEMVEHEGKAFFNRTYESLLQPMEGKPLSVGGKYVHPGDSRDSPLIWHLYGRQIGEQYEKAPYDRPIVQMPPKMPLTEDEVRTFVEWIDLGAQWDNIPGPDPCEEELR